MHLFPAGGLGMTAPAHLEGPMSRREHSPEMIDQVMLICELFPWKQWLKAWGEGGEVECHV